MIVFQSCFFAWKYIKIMFFFYFFKLFFISVHQNDKKKHEKINFKQKNKKLPNLYLKRNTKHELRVVTSVDLR